MTTPRDAIGLSDRLRDGSDNWLMSDSAREEIATQLDALHKELAQTQAHLAIRNGDLAEAVRERDALQARVKELEAADRYANLISIIADIREKSGLGGYPMLSELADAIGSKLADAESRATSAEQERDKLQGMLLLCGELGGIGKDETPVAYLRRLIDGLIDAGRERNEALERAAQCAEGPIYKEIYRGGPGHNWHHIKQPGHVNDYGNGRLDAAAAIRRLAAGTEKEKRE